MSFPLISGVYVPQIKKNSEKASPSRAPIVQLLQKRMA